MGRQKEEGMGSERSPARPRVPLVPLAPDPRAPEPRAPEPWSPLEPRTPEPLLGVGPLERLVVPPSPWGAHTLSLKNTNYSLHITLFHIHYFSFYLLAKSHGRLDSIIVYFPRHFTS